MKHVKNFRIRILKNKLAGYLLTQSMTAINLARIFLIEQSGGQFAANWNDLRTADMFAVSFVSRTFGSNKMSDCKCFMYETYEENRSDKTKLHFPRFQGVFTPCYKVLSEYPLEHKKIIFFWPLETLFQTGELSISRVVGS